MKVSHVIRDERATSVVPGTSADAISRIDCSLSSRSRRAEISAPRSVACAGGRSQCLTMSIRPGKTAKISAFAESDARDKETHWLRCSGGSASSLRRRSSGGRCLLPKHEMGAGNRQSKRHEAGK